MIKKFFNDNNDYFIKKTYEINNDCIEQLQHCCDEHYQTCPDFSEEEQERARLEYLWLEDLKKTNSFDIYFVKKLPDNADLKNKIYCVNNDKYNVHRPTTHEIFNDVLKYFYFFEDAWNKNMNKEGLDYYHWSSKKSLLDSIKLINTLQDNIPISKNKRYLNDLEKWVNTGDLEEKIVVTYHSC